MLKPLLVLVLVLATIAGLGFGWYEHGRAERAIAMSTEVPPAAKNCPQANLASLTRAVSSIVDAKREAKPRVEGMEDAEEVESFDDLSTEDQAKIFEAGDELADSSRQSLTYIIAKLRLTSEQANKLREDAARMNERVARSLDRVVALMSQETPVRPREAIDAIAEGLNAVREADDGFRTSLDEGQRKSLDDEEFDMTSAIDPSVLLPGIIALTGTVGSPEGEEP